MSQHDAAEKALGMVQQQQPLLFPGQGPEDVLLTTAEAAVYLRRSTATLEAWRRQGIGPKVTKLGPRGIRYSLANLRRFLNGGAE
jgi:Helix-turn-helix domain